MIQNKNLFEAAKFHQSRLEHHGKIFIALMAKCFDEMPYHSMFVKTDRFFPGFVGYRDYDINLIQHTKIEYIPNPNYDPNYDFVGSCGKGGNKHEKGKEPWIRELRKETKLVNILGVEKSQDQYDECFSAESFSITDVPEELFLGYKSIECIRVSL